MECSFRALAEHEAGAERLDQLHVLHHETGEEKFAPYSLTGLSSHLVLNLPVPDELYNALCGLLHQSVDASSIW